MPNRTWAQEAVSARTGRDIADLLRELYVEKRHTQQEIAEAIGVERVTVSQWLRDLGISRDDRAPLELDPA
jgi:DNA-binding XRE family transcriptional regulator